MNAGDDDFDFMTEAEIGAMLDRLRHNKSSSVQALSVIKRIVRTDVGARMAIDAVPAILACSSHEFCELWHEFHEAVVRDPLVTSALFTTLRAFDYEGNARVAAYSLSIKIMESAEIKMLPEIVSYTLFVLPHSAVTDCYERLKELLYVHDELEVYKAFESGIKPHLHRFFGYLSRVASWTFFDFFVLLLGMSRPSLRSKVSNIIWQSLMNGNLSIATIAKFVKKDRLLGAKFHAILRFVDIVVGSVPKAVSATAIFPMVSVFMVVIQRYPGAIDAFIEQMISYVLEGPHFAACVAISALLRMDREPLSTHTIYMDDVVSQSVSLYPRSLHALCQVIARATPSRQRPMLLVSLPKRLFHHSQSLIETGVVVALHLVMVEVEESREIMGWVLRAINMNWLVIKPSVLLLVVDLMWRNKDPTLINEMLSFCLNIVSGYSLVAVVKAKTPVIGANMGKFAISFSKVPDENYGELCGEVIAILATLLPSARLDKLPGKFPKEHAEYLMNVTDLSYVVPKEFIALMENPKDEIKIRGSQAHILLVCRSFVFGVMSKVGHNMEDVLFFMQIANSIDIFFTSVCVQMRRAVPDFEASVIAPEFVFQLLKDAYFEFPDHLNLLGLMFRSLRAVFIEMNHDRHISDEPMTFLGMSMEHVTPLRIVTIVDRLVRLARGSIKHNTIVKKCVRAISDAIDFVTLCTTLRDVNVDFSNDIAPMFELIDDVGVACRLIVLGIHMKVPLPELSLIANRFQSNFRSDLGDNPILFPFGLPHMEAVVRPYRDGSNWRLSVYFCLAVPKFEQFAERFEAMLKEISEGHTDVQISLVLIDILETRIPEFRQYYDNCVLLATDLARLVIEADASVLIPMIALIKTINITKPPELRGSPSLYGLWRELHSAFRRFGVAKSDKRLQKLFASIQGESDMLIDSQDVPKEAPRIEVPVRDSIFSVNDSSDDFTGNSVSISSDSDSDSGSNE